MKKTTAWIFRATNCQNSIPDDLDIAKKKNLPREAVQNNPMRANHINAKIDNILENSKCWLFSDRDETVNDIISECSKLAQKKYKNQTRLGGESDLLEIMKKAEISQY